MASRSRRQGTGLQRAGGPRNSSCKSHERPHGTDKSHGKRGGKSKFQGLRKTKEPWGPSPGGTDGGRARKEQEEEKCCARAPRRRAEWSGVEWSGMEWSTPRRLLSSLSVLFCRQAGRLAGWQAGWLEEKQCAEMRCGAARRRRRCGSLLRCFCAFRAQQSGPPNKRRARPSGSTRAERYAGRQGR